MSNFSSIITSELGRGGTLLPVIGLPGNEAGIRDLQQHLVESNSSSIWLGASELPQLTEELVILIPKRGHTDRDHLHTTWTQGRHVGGGPACAFHKPPSHLLELVVQIFDF